MIQSPRVEYDAEGIAWVVFDDPESKVNVLGTEQMQQLDAVLDELYKRKPKAAVFISAKPGIFIAGADIKELQRIHDASLGADLSRAGHRILAKIEQLGVPTVAAIDGACLGGGWAARMGGAGITVGAMRVTFFGALAMAVTAGVGALFGTSG